MPRNSSGTYALPSGNPVAPNTLIETAWANPTMADLGQALTESLDRYGRGNMLAPLKLIDGTAAAPTLTFSSESTSGLYRISPGVLGFSIAGIEKWRVSATGVNVTGDMVATGNVGAAGWTGNLAITGNLSVTGTTSMTNALTITRTGGVNTNSYVTWTDGLNSTGYLSIRTSGVGIGSDNFIDFSTGQLGVSNAFNQRMRLAQNGQLIVGGTSAISAADALSLIGASGTGQLSVQNGTAVSFFGGGNSTGSVYGTASNVPIDLYVNNGFVQRWDTSGNSGLGTQTIGSFGHGGTNRILQIANGNTGTNSQSHVILTTGFNGSGVSAAGTISWGATIAGTGASARIGSVGFTTDSNHTSGTPSGRFQISTKGPSDATALSRVEVDSLGGFYYGGIEVGYRNLPFIVQNSNYTLVSTDRGKGQLMNVSGTVTVPNSVFTGGDVMTVVNNSGAALTIAQGSGVTLRLGGSGTTGNRTLANNGAATILAITPAVFIVLGTGVS